MIANEVDVDIVMSAEVPSDFESKKLPFLDTQMWMEEDREGKIIIEEAAVQEIAGREVETVTARVHQGVQSDTNNEEDRETEQRCDLRNCCNIL